jgi:hypothetical protein
VLEHQQALLLGVLRRAGGAAVSYAELHQAGIEFPASVVSELELAGVPIERCYGRAPGERRVVSVRLDPALDPAFRPAGSSVEAHQPEANRVLEPAWGEVREYRTRPMTGLGEAAWAWVSGTTRAPRAGLAWLFARDRASADRVFRLRCLKARGPASGLVSSDPQTPAATGHKADGYRSGRRLLAMLALLAAVSVAAAVVVVGATQSGRRHAAAVVHRHPRGLALAPRATDHVRPPSPARASAQPPTPVSLALATNLETRGHTLLEAQRPTVQAELALALARQQPAG